MRRFVIAVAATLIASSALAQSAGEMADRLGRLERDVNFLQKQVYTGSAANDPNALPIASGSGAAQFEVRMSAIEEQMRLLRGQVETAQFNAGESQRAIARLKEDIDYRLQALEQAQSTGAVAAPLADAPPAAVDTPVAVDVPAPTPDEPASYKPGAPAVTGADFPDANAAYNAAFKQLNAKNYSGAATQFDAFVRTYPKDPLTSNAYYWLGESHYARGDYTRAAEGFRKGFENNPKGQKAPDNLLKLALSLDRIKRTSEACIVLGQVVSKYGDSAPRTAQRAQTERTRMQCQ